MIRASMGKITQIKKNDSEVGETIEMKFERIMNNNEPIKDGAPLIYQDRDEGVAPGYDIRTDRFEIAVMGMDTVEKSIQAKRENKAKEIAKKVTESETTNTTQKTAN